MQNPQLITTADGSHSLYHAELNETYHSKHGAIQESKHIFIEAGLKAVDRQELLQSLNILEMGFGTGLNVFLTYLEAPKRFIHYTSLEAYPIDDQIVRQLNYPKLLKVSESEQQFFEAMHQCPWEEKIALSPNFYLTKRLQKLQTTTLPPNHFHLVYFDAFAPEVQADLWTEKIFAKIYATMASGGILTTYCAKGIVKRALKKVGFEVFPMPGPPGKREMTKAVK